MNIKTFQLGELNANCYLAMTAPDQCIAVDIGGSPRMLLEFLKMKNLRLTKILLTHGHFDHIGGVEEVRAAVNAEVFIHEEDAEMLQSSTASLHSSISIMPFKAVAKYTTLHGGEIISDGESSFRVLHTPGHSHGSVCYVTDDTIFSGDTLFCCSIGRTDFPGGNVQQMRDSLGLLYSLEGDYKVLPGHNEPTELSYEKQNNPYMKPFRT